MYIDTHCHLNMMVKREHDKPLSEAEMYLIETIVAEALQNGVNKILNVGTSVAETENSIAIAQHIPNVYAAAGIHPCDCTTNWRKDFEVIKKLVNNHAGRNVKAIGETGLDFYHKPFDKGRQIDSFKAHIDLALTHDLPLVVHVRDSADDVLRVLEEFKGQIRGVNHCFMQEAYVAETLYEWGFYFGIDGPITYPQNDAFREVVKNIPLERLILETDAPFLPPQEMRGKQNHPQYIPLIAEMLAEVKGVSVFDLAAMTTTNAQALFDI